MSVAEGLFFPSPRNTLADVTGLLSGPVWSNVKDPQFAGGAVGDDTHDDTDAFLAAIAATPPGGFVLLPSYGGSAYVISQELVLSQPYVRFASFGGHGQASSGVRLRWAGPLHGNMMRQTAKGIQTFGVTFNCDFKADTALTQTHAESYVLEEVNVYKSLGYAWILGDGVANCNNLWARNVTLVYENGGAGLLMNVPGTENLEFHNLNIVGSDNVTAGAPLLSMTQGAADFYGLLLDDNNYTDYGAVFLSGATFRMFNLISEMKQTLQANASAKGRGSAIIGADLRSCDVQAGKHAIDYNVSGSSAGLVTMGMRVKTLAGAANGPTIRASNGLVDLGSWFEAAGGDPLGNFAGTYQHFGVNTLLNVPIDFDNASGGVAIHDSGGTARTILDLTASDNLQVGAAVGVNDVNVDTGTGVVNFNPGGVNAGRLSSSVPVLPTGAGKTVDDVITALQTLKFVKQV